MEMEKYAAKLGMRTYVRITPDMLVPEERIRAYCEENKCGSYGRNYMCPPHAGTLDEIRDRLKRYTRGYLVQYSAEADMASQRKEVIKTRDVFHGKILKLETYLEKQGANGVWGMTGGNCGLCEICRVVDGKPCRHPEKARMSLEAAGVDVIGLLDRLGIDSEFRKDRITWTGCVLY